MSQLLELGKKVLAAQSFSQMIGTEISHLVAGNAELTLNIGDTLLQQNGFVHGGVLCYMADNCLTFAGGTALGEAVVTSEFKINYVRPAKGRKVIARSTVLHSGNRQAVCQCKVFVDKVDDKKLVAVAQGTISKLSE